MMEEDQKVPVRSRFPLDDLLWRGGTTCQLTNQRIFPIQSYINCYPVHLQAILSIKIEATRIIEPIIMTTQYTTNKQVVLH